MVKYFFHLMRLLFRSYQRPYCKYWDAVLLKFLTKGTIKLDGSHTCIVSLGGKELRVWISNKFYSYGHEYTYFGECEQRRPSFNTMLILESKIDALRAEQERKKNNAHSNRMREIFTSK